MQAVETIDWLLHRSFKGSCLDPGGILLFANQKHPPDLCLVQALQALSLSVAADFL